MGDRTTNPRKRGRTGCITCRWVDDRRVQWEHNHRRPHSRYQNHCNSSRVLIINLQNSAVKCDETKPSCNRCLQAKRTCDGYTPDGPAAVLGRRELAVVVRTLSTIRPAARVLARPQTADDVAFFDFFRLRTAPAAGAFFPTDFWSRRILQVAHAEPAVWNAALAIGALHRRSELTNMPTGHNNQQRTQSTEQALLRYGNALTEAQSISDPSKLLVLSLALAAVSNLSGNWTHSRVHVDSGRRLLHQMQTEEALGRQQWDSELDSTRHDPV
ncbi:hypothetical protein B0T17DRAFT_97161 [Bombardia bombarda]|uniref:Zn(2)-C6 fungal-type domain-containing protein n=1 Tax=Bombardia bombarda TaxID=252184 RepID=A0AA39XN06_9PEZI|nr:hypothetical protein B0T17DRAFT_97161 [Bombardia bombarda]